MSQKQKKKSPVPLVLLLLFFIAVCAVAVIKICQVQQERSFGNEAYTNLAQSLTTMQTPQTTQIPVTVVEQEEDTAAETNQTSIVVDFDALQAINQEGVAWISSDDRVIHYPVMQGTDNDYYLDHLPDGTVNRNGSIFMDFRNEPDFSDKNTFIYGHNMLDGTMFASLSRYSEAGYYDKHPSLLLVAPSGSYSLEVFAGCVVSGNSDVYQLSFRDEADFAAYVEKVTELSDFQTSVEVSAADRLVSLSTCAYDYDDARYVLFCRLRPMQ